MHVDFVHFYRFGLTLTMHLLSWYAHAYTIEAEKNVRDYQTARVSHTVHVYTGLLLTWLYIDRRTGRDILSLPDVVEQFAQAIKYLS